MAFNGLGRATLVDGVSGRYYVDRGGDMGANIVSAHPENGINMQLIASDQTKVIEAAFPDGEYQHFVYWVTITCKRLSTTSQGHTASPTMKVVTFSLQGGGFV